MVFVQLIAQYLIGVACTAWMIMLGVGAAHHNWWNEMPTMGYGEAFSSVFAATYPLALVGLIVYAVVLAIVASR